MNEPTRAVRIASAQTWLLGKCSLCGTPLVREEQGPFGQRWHYHEVPAEPAQEPATPPNAPDPSTDRGTGEPEAHARPQAADLLDAVRDAHTQCDCDECLGKIAAAVLNAAAASLRRLGHTAAATLLGHTADDMGDGHGDS